jgi:hypothetical protein
MKYKATHVSKRANKNESFLIRNISQYDINLGDLKYKIKAGKVVDLYGETAHLNKEVIQKSLESGSISKRLGKSLVLISNTSQTPIIPIITESNKIIEFPRHAKSSIIIEVGKIDKDVESMILEDDDAFLKELEFDGSGDGSAPIIAKEK